MNPLRKVPVLLLMAVGFQLLNGCSKLTDHNIPPDTGSYSADVVTSWLKMQLKVTQTTPASPTLMARRFGYAGIAAYEAVVPGSATYRSLVGQLNGLPSLPTLAAGERYHWPAAANAALAASLKAYYPTTSAANLFSIDSLEAANTAQFVKDGSANDELGRSVDFGKKIAAAVFDWAKTDGFDDATPFVLPVGPGLWVPTPPAFAPPAFPNWIKCRPLVTGSDAGADQGGPRPYSEDPASAYYAQAKELYDISQTLTPDQRTTVLFWADNPDGKSFTGPGHVNSILLQVMGDKKPALDAAAQAFAYVGIALTDATISTWKSKYKYFAVRPITYIRSVLNQPAWNTVIATPAHPEYPAAHAVILMTGAQALTTLYGANYKFTDHAYDGVGFSPRSFNSFEEAATEGSNSRVFAGIHYRKSCNDGLMQGKKVVENINGQLNFKK